MGRYCLRLGALEHFLVSPNEVGWIAAVLVELAKIQWLIGLDAV
jgi:hypothetical protein